MTGRLALGSSGVGRVLGDVLEDWVDGEEERQDEVEVGQLEPLELEEEPQKLGPLDKLDMLNRAAANKDTEGKQEKGELYNCGAPPAESSGTAVTARRRGLATQDDAQHETMVNTHLFPLSLLWGKSCRSTVRYRFRIGPAGRRPAGEPGWAGW